MSTGGACPEKGRSTPAAEVVAALASNTTVLLLFALHIAAAAPFLAWGRDWHLRFGYVWLTVGWFAGSAVLLLWARLRGRLGEYLRPRAVAEALLVLALAAPFQSTFNSLKQVLPEWAPFVWDERLAALDRALHGGVDPWRLLGWAVREPVLLHGLDLVYMLWFPLLVVVVVWCGWSVRVRLRQRLLLSTLLAFILIGTAGAYLLSSAGPCYYGRLVPGPDPFAELMAALERRVDVEGALLFAVDNQRGIWEAWKEDRHLTFGGISAMPSMHVAMVVLVALAAGGVDRRLGWAAWIFAGLTFLGSVALGWHYAVDGYVGGLAAAAIWVWVGRWRSVRALPERFNAV